MTRLLPYQILSILIFVGCGVYTKTVIETGAAARTQITANGLSLPASATDLYYAFQPQFSDHLDTWVSFSASQADCRSVAQAVASKMVATPVFTSGTRSKHKNVTGGPAYHHPKYTSIYWNLSTVTNGSMFECKGLFVLIDTDKNKVYISFRAP